MKERSREKIYGHLSGVVEKDEDIIDLPIGRKKATVKNIVKEDGKEAITKYKVIERYTDASLLDVQILQGKPTKYGSI